MWLLSQAGAQCKDLPYKKDNSTDDWAIHDSKRVDYGTNSNPIDDYLKPNSTSFLNDLNSELIDTYECVKEDVESVIDELKQFKNTEKDYYDIRSKKFRKETKLAARFIYLNQTSFNGIYRVNLKGEYNVPFGHRRKDFFEPENLRLVSKTLNNSVLNSGNFAESINDINKGDLVFLDPPYTITHNNNGFFK